MADFRGGVTGPKEPGLFDRFVSFVSGGKSTENSFTVEKEGSSPTSKMPSWGDALEGLKEFGKGVLKVGAGIVVFAIAVPVLAVAAAAITAVAVGAVVLGVGALLVAVLPLSALAAYHAVDKEGAEKLIDDLVGKLLPSEPHEELLIDEDFEINFRNTYTRESYDETDGKK